MKHHMELSVCVISDLFGLFNFAWKEHRATVKLRRYLKAKEAVPFPGMNITKSKNEGMYSNF